MEQQIRTNFEDLCLPKPVANSYLRIYTDAPSVISGIEDFRAGWMITR